MKVVLGTLAALTGSAVALAQTAARAGDDAATTLGAWSRIAKAFAERSVQAAEALRDFPGIVGRLGERLSAGRGLVGLLELAGLLVLIFVGARLIEAAISARLRRRGRALLEKGTGRLGERLSTLATMALIGTIEIGLFTLLAAIGIQIALADAPLRNQLAIAAGFAIIATRLGHLLLNTVLAPQARWLRLLPVSDDRARLIRRRGSFVAALAAVAYFGSDFLLVSALPPVFANTWFLVLGLAVTVLCFLGLGAAPTVAVEARDTPDSVSTVKPNETLRGFFGLAGPRVLPVLLIAAWIIWSINVLLGHRESAMAVLICASIVFLFPAIDRCCRTILGWAESSDSSSLASDPRRWRLRSRLLLYVGRALLVGIGVILALEAWGFGTFHALATPVGQKVLHAVLTLATAVPIAMLIWYGSHSLLERKLGPLPGPGDEIPGTRAHTLVPILRTFLLILLLVVVAMMVLVSLGVEIGPIIAGAGIFGVAIGFGSQSLVRDVISGFFFLLDDAFRLGEYIDVGKCKGTVEKISVRSLQLRHHRGALNTIPFGQVQSISNYTRDWVIEKLEFGLVYGTDPEKVRKLIKKIGQELAANPELAPDIIDPLKSQGMQRFGDSAVIFRAKVKCRPGRQFTVRREAYRRMQEAFAANGIELAYPTINYRELSSVSPT